MPVSIDEAAFAVHGSQLGLRPRRVARRRRRRRATSASACSRVRGADAWIGGVGVVAGRRGRGDRRAADASRRGARRGHAGVTRIWLEVLVQNEPGDQALREARLRPCARPRGVVARRRACVPGTQSPARCRSRRRIGRAARAACPGSARTSPSRTSPTRRRVARRARGAASIALAAGSHRSCRLAADDEDAIRELLGSLPGRGHRRSATERARGRPGQRRARVARRHAGRAPARDGARAV